MISTTSREGFLVAGKIILRYQQCHLLLWPPYGIGHVIIFLPYGFYLSFFLFYFFYLFISFYLSFFLA